MEKQQVIQALGALAHETRLDIFRVLVQAGPGGVAAGAIAETIGAVPATLSFHLKELKNAGVVSARREGRSLIYAPEFDRMQDLLSFLTENCCQGAGGCSASSPA
jgi:DNA-binding transcriptional ArsR family regulator